MKNLLFILIDCLRADFCFGPARKVKTPTLDRLREQGTTFSHAVSVTSTTSPCVASILTGTYPFNHGIRSLLGYKLNPGCATLPEVLKRNGYRTQALVTGPLTRELGLDRGFDEYHCRPQHETLYTEFGADLRKRLDLLSQGPSPWFVFLHLFELHMPRQIVPPFRAREFGRTTYERALSCLDHHLERVVESVDPEKTVLAIHADHGENILPPFLESLLFAVRRKGLSLRRAALGFTRKNRYIWMGHGYHVYDFLVRVPLVLVGKGLFPEEKVLSQQMSQVDIFPTLMDALELPMARGAKIHGRSVMPLVRGWPLPERPVYLNASGIEIQEKDWLEGIRTSKWKFVYAPWNGKVEPELYDLEQDPGETRNLAAERADIVDQLKAEILAIQSGSDGEGETAMAAADMEIVKKRLEDLGYL